MITVYKLILEFHKNDEFQIKNVNVTLELN